jgi:hypothetical protein
MRPSLWSWSGFLPLVPALIVFGLAWFGKAGLAHWALALLSAVLGYHGERSRRLLRDIAPLIAVALGYDLFRYVQPLFVTESRVLGCGLRGAELALFPAGGGATWGEALAARHVPALDLLAAIPYTLFIYVVFGYGAYLFFRDRARMRRYVLAFAVANYLAFAFWLTLPAAPPWYIHQHGCGIDLATAPNPGGLSRVDALLGIQYFAQFYGKAASVFGALPSLHCAYPVIGLLTAFRVTPWRFRSVHLAYALVMPLAALYLDHHWILDVVLGWVTAGLAVWLADRWLSRARPVAAEPVQASLALAAVPAEGERPRAT